MKLIVLLLSAILFSFLPAQAQTSDAENDLRVVESLKKERQSGGNMGIVVVHAHIARGPAQCIEVPMITFGRVIDGKMRTITTGLPTGIFFVQFLAMKAVPAGEYYILSVSCGLTGREHVSMGGPHAKFLVRAGEATNAGMLRLDLEPDNFFNLSGTVRRSVQPITPFVMNKFTTKMPLTSKVLVNRPMTIISPVSKYKRRGLFG